MGGYYPAAGGARPLAGLLLLLLLWLPLQAGAGGRLTLLHFNDFHGQLAPFRDSETGIEVGGIARLAGTVARIRAEVSERPVVLLFAGDLLQGTLLSSLFHGHPDIGMFNAMGVDAAVLGNHELDYGQENLRALLEEARFPVLAANVHLPRAPPNLGAGLVLTPPGGPRIGILGLTTAELITATHPRNTNGVRVDDPRAAARRELAALAGASDLVVVLSHMGFRADRELARSEPGVDLIIGGHDHFVFPAPVTENGVPILQAGDRGRFLGRLDLAVTERGVELLAYRLIPMDASAPADTLMVQRVAALKAGVSKQLDSRVGRAATPLDGRRETIRREESNLGSFVADLAREVTGVEVALLNGGGFRDSIPAGEVTLGRVQRVFPFGNELATGRITGAQLQQALDHSAELEPETNPGGFLQVSGLRFAIDHGRAVEVRINGEPLDPAREYTLVIPDFLAAGGDGYAMLMQLRDPVATGHRLSDLLIEAFRRNDLISVGVDGRIRRLEADSNAVR